METVELREGTMRSAESTDDVEVGNHRSARTPMATPIEFICDFDIVSATGVNVSESGICFDIDEPLVFEMQLVLDGERHTHRAELVRMEALPDGGCRLGLRFAPAQPVPSV